MTRDQFHQIASFFHELTVENLDPGERVVKVRYSCGGAQFVVGPLHYHQERLLHENSIVKRHPLVLDIQKHDWPTNKDNVSSIEEEMTKLCAGDRERFKELLDKIQLNIRKALEDGMQAQWWPNILNNNHWHDVVSLIQSCIDRPGWVKEITSSASNEAVYETYPFDHLIYKWVSETKRQKLGVDRRAFSGRYDMINNLIEAAEKYIAGEFTITAEQLESLWQRFHERELLWQRKHARQDAQAFVDFQSPGDFLLETELDYKRKALKRYQDEVGNHKLRQWVESGQGDKALSELRNRLGTNLVAFQSWRSSIGASDQQSLAVLKAYLDSVKNPYAGPATVAPIIQATIDQGLKPAWDTLSTLLWALRPDNYFPIKIDYFRKLAVELASELPDGRPDADKFDALMRFGTAFRKALQRWKPADWIDVQSFIWVVCPVASSGEEVNQAGGIRDREEEEIVTPRATRAAINLILYGPPGTGKTYQTIQRSIEIVDLDLPDDVESQKQRFDDLVKERRIEFITFHQSYSYEDFIEGIRPTLNADSEEVTARYECRPGVFKSLATRALFECLERVDTQMGLPSFNALWTSLLAKIDADPEAKYPGLTEKTSYQLIITERGNIEGTNVLSDKETRFLCSRKILEEVFEAKRQEDAINVTDVMKVVKRGCHSQFVAAMFNELRRLEKSDSLETAAQKEPIPDEDKAAIVQRFLTEGEKSGYRLRLEHNQEQFVLVIDEINRGNISKILGELITLIEDDKRVAHKNQLIATLPYSGEKFGVPPNLNLLGTMNTADKSIALVDIALRRRFDFEEIGVDLRICAGLSDRMRAALEELNKRILLRKDRDHQIGHAYFISVADETGFNQCFRKQIIPLLQEYFYNDWDGLRYVLGENSGAADGRFIRKVSGADVKEARTKWQWFFDADAAEIDCLQTLCSSYSIV